MSYVKTDDSGSTWSTGTISSLSNPGDIVCPSTDTCFATGATAARKGAVFFTNDGGTTWTVEQAPARTAYLEGISCASTMSCYAVGTANVGSGNSQAVALVTTDGGSTWSTDDISSGQSATAIDCPSTTTCFVSDGEVISGRDQEVIFATSDGGSTWTTQILPSGTTYIPAIACPSTSVCYAAREADSSTIIETTDGGSTWAAQTLPSGSGTNVDDISCVSTTTCYAVANTPGTLGNQFINTGHILATNDGGADWSLEEPPTGTYGFYGIACPSPSSCYITGEGYGAQGGVIFTN